MSQLPKGWVEIPLDQVATWGSGGTPKRSEPSYYGGDVPWVKTGDLGPRYLKEASEYISQLGLEKSSAKLFPKGSVVIAMYGATIGKTSILDFEASTNQACAVGYPIDGVILTDFLYYFLTSEKQNFIKKGKGGAQPNISQQLIKAHDIRLPSLPEQKRIVEKLDEVLAQVDTIKARLDGIPDLLKRFRQSVLASAVSGKLTEEWQKGATFRSEDDSFSILREFRGKPLKELPIGWKWVRFDAVNEVASNLVDPLDNPNDYHIAPNHIESKSGRLLEYTTVEEDKVKSSKHRFWAGQVLYSKIRPYLCKAVLVDFTGVCSADMYPLNTNMEPKYLLNWLLSDLFTEWASNGDSRTVLPKINKKQLSEIPCALPPKEEQKEIVRLVDQYFAFADTIEAQVKKAQARVDNLTQSILAKAFRGELVPQNDDDEPAEVLLERIAKARKEAEALAKAAKKAGKKKA